MANSRGDTFANGGTISSQEMRKVNEEMREIRAINGFRLELLGYINGEIPQWIGCNEAVPITFIEKWNEGMLGKSN